MDNPSLAPNGSEISGSGNTKPTRCNSCINWCFTWNNYPVNWKDFFGSEMFHSYVMQEETGESGTKHLQGYIHCDKKRRWSEFGLPSGIHWEKCKSVKDSIAYCQKVESRTGEQFYKNIKPIRPIKLIDPTYSWEKEILDIIKNEADERTINWYYSLQGGVGKTQFAKYLAAKHGAIPLDGKKNDMLYVASEFESDIYMLVLSRTQEDYVSYDTLEKIKDGLFMCAKYESKPIIRNSPHIFVFANFPPDKERVSQDRWRIVEIIK